MDNKPLIFEFQTESGNLYVYDACSNYTYPVEPVDVDVIKNYYKLNHNGIKKQLVKKHSKDNFIISYKKVSDWIRNDKAFYPPWKTASEFISEDDYKKRLINVKQLTLEVTQRCNLRCKYCIFNDDYPLHRKHSLSDMMWEVAKKSIDYYIQLINSKSRTNPLYFTYLSFYGGEPLLNFALIQKCVGYIKKTK